MHGLDPSSLLAGSDASSGTRYCGDSLKYKQSDPGSDEFDSGRSQAQVGTLKLDLPFDEEDYLVPSPQLNQNVSTYVDLISEPRTSDDNSGSSKLYVDYSKTNIDNPEYLMSQDVPCQTIGIPTVSEYIQHRASRSNSESSCSNLPQAYQPQRSIEEESDHEYYNDSDRLQRELQPLKSKGETTI